MATTIATSFATIRRDASILGAGLARRHIDGS